MPAGKLDKNENPLTCAIRELEEETGYKSQNVFKIGEIFTTPGFCSEKLYLYLAMNLTEGNHNREEGEYGMKVFDYSIKEIEEKISNAEIRDAKTICAIHLAKNHL